MKKKFGIAVMMMAISLITISAQAQDRPQADLQVRSVSVNQISKTLRAGVTLYNYWDDDAAQVILHILLPVGVKVLSVSSGCTASPFFDGTQGVVNCKLGDIAVGATKTVYVTTDLPRDDKPKTFGAFAVSLLPDPIPSNNYGEGTAP